MKKRKIQNSYVTSSNGSRQQLNLLSYNNQSDLTENDFVGWDVLNADLVKRLVSQTSSNDQVDPTNFAYVAKNGLDTNNGSAEKPYLTVQKAIDQSSIGTTIYIYPGTYTENLTLKAGVNLTSPIKFGVYIIGNHTISTAGTIVLDNVTLNSTTGNTLSVTGATSINIQLIGTNVYSISGDAINWANTNSASKLYIEDGSISVSTSGSTARAFYSTSTSTGSIITNRTTFKLNNAANVCLSLNGSVSFTHTSDQVYGQIAVADTASYVGQLVALTATGIPCIVTNSTATSILFACTLTSTVTPIQGAGAFVYSALSYGSTGVGTATTLNGGIGAIAIPLSSLAIRNSVLRPTPQDGLLEYDGTHLYFTIGTTRKTVTLA